MSSSLQQIDRISEILAQIKIDSNNDRGKSGNSRSAEQVKVSLALLGVISRDAQLRLKVINMGIPIIIDAINVYIERSDIGECNECNV